MENLNLNLNLDIRSWYMLEYPDDELGCEINGSITFKGLWDGMLLGGGGFDVYLYLGVCDSIVRQRVFEWLSQIYDVEYDVVYDMWLGE